MMQTAPRSLSVVWAPWLVSAVLAGCGGGDAGDEAARHAMQASQARDAAILSGNLLLNPTFDAAALPGNLPTAPGNWRGDLSASVAAEMGIVPHSGTTMLKFQATDAQPGPDTLTGQQWQVVDLGQFAAAIAAGGVRAEALAWFNRVAGDERTDRRFDLRVMAFDGSPGDLPERYLASNWLAEDTAPLVSAGDRWQKVGASLPLPPGTTYMLVEISVSEDVSNDADAPEFAGHYADDISLMLTSAR